MEIQKKIGAFISLRMGIAMSFVMSAVGSFIGAMEASKTSPAPFPAIWIPSFLLSFVIACIIAIAIGFIVPMKKVNDTIEVKTKTKGFVLHLLQSLASDIIYTIFIATVMAFVMTAVFALPNGKKGINKEIEETQIEIDATKEQIAANEAELGAIKAKGDDATPAELGKVEQLSGELGGLNEKMGGLNGKLGGLNESLSHMSLVPMALKSLAKSIIFEFLIALVVIMIIEPIIQKAAFKKYIPGYGQGVAGDDAI